jgi:hypothetical protein
MKININLLRLEPFSQLREMASKATPENTLWYMPSRRVVAVVTRVIARRNMPNASSRAGLYVSRSSRNTFPKEYKNAMTKKWVPRQESVFDKTTIKMPIRTNVLIDVFLWISNLTFFLFGSHNKKQISTNYATTVTTRPITQHYKRVYPYKTSCYDSATTATTVTITQHCKPLQTKIVNCYDSIIKEILPWQF